MMRDWLKFNSAWQPFTFGGVAAFAKASLARLLLFQLLFALITAGTVVWFLNQAWRPAIERAIAQLPERGEIRNGQLSVPDEKPQLLSESRFLAFMVDLNHTGTIRVPAHIQVEFGARTVRVISLFGYWDRAYATEWIIDFNKAALGPWWGAWRLPLFWIAFGMVFGGLILTWWILACVYSLPAWLTAFFSNRRLSLGGSWKLTGAALLPAGLLMTLGIFFYALSGIGLVELLGIQVAHWFVGIAYWTGATLRVPRVDSLATAKNPFDSESKDSASPKPPKSKNPFQS